MIATSSRFEALYRAAHDNGLRGIDAWETGRADIAAHVCEHPDELGAWRHWWDLHFGSPLNLALSWRHGSGVRWIMTSMSAVDHLLPECPAVRRHRGHAAYGLGLVDPDDPELCGWCGRVARARRGRAAS